MESFWEGLRCEVMVPCIEPCGRKTPGSSLFDVEKLIESKRRNRLEFPCAVCNEWQGIDQLLRNAPAVRTLSAEVLLVEFADLRNRLNLIYGEVGQSTSNLRKYFEKLDANDKRLLSRVDDAYTSLMQALTDEAKEGPRLFSLVPVNRKIFNPKQWTSAKFRITLWCEHSRLPLSSLNGKGSKKGVYEIELTHEWFKRAAPYLKVLTATLSLVLPIASSGVKLALDETTYKSIEEQLDFGKEMLDATFEGSEKISGWLESKDSLSAEHGEAIRAQGAILREFQTIVKAKTPGTAGSCA